MTKIEGVTVRISRRAAESTFDVRFLPAPESGPGGFTFAFYGAERPVDPEEVFSEVQRTILAFREDGFPL
ncbi:hypothetical protein BJH93_08365 [Kocuria polaris]|nr:hypothetical protein [Kocuria polaris]